MMTKGRMSNKRIMSLMKETRGENLRASPKHPHSLTAPVIAEYPVKNRKNTIIASRIHLVNLKNPQKKIEYARKTSVPEIKIASGRAKGVKNGRFNTEGLKYSSSLYEKPRGSLSFTTPETKNMVARIALKT